MDATLKTLVAALDGYAGSFELLDHGGCSHRNLGRGAASGSLHCLVRCFWPRSRKQADFRQDPQS
jgi:hypothetical protein